LDLSDPLESQVKRETGACLDFKVPLVARVKLVFKVLEDHSDPLDLLVFLVLQDRRDPRDLLVPQARRETLD